MQQNGHAQTEHKINVVSCSAWIAPDLELESVGIDRSDDIPFRPFVETDSLLHVILVVAPFKSQSVDGRGVKNMASYFVRRIPDFFY